VANAIGASARFEPLDVTKEEGWAAVVAATTQHFGKLDVLVNNAGISGSAEKDFYSTEAWHRIMAINATGVFFGIKYAIPAMVANRSQARHQPRAGAVARVHWREARHDYAQNSETVFTRVKDRLDARLKTPATANIVSVVRPVEDPAPPGMHDFDLVTFFYAYHDITYLGVDRAKVNKAFYDALKPGGELVVGDYSAKPGAGTSVVQTLHRSDEALIRSEIEAAGFELIAPAHIGVDHQRKVGAEM
jgi:NAD(P)-dependent dehydrogenase (short-subunit alcohol dehydrogenase family)